MSDFYEVMQIEGKGLGCVATKDIKRGTLILREKAQIFDNGEEQGTPGWIKSVLMYILTTAVFIIFLTISIPFRLFKDFSETFTTFRYFFLQSCFIFFFIYQVFQ